jgi:hypothetical protein
MVATSDDLRLPIDLYKDSNTVLVSLWTYFASLAVPLLVFVLGFTNRIPGRVKIALAVIFSFFAGLNAYSMWRAQLTLQSAAQAIQRLTKEVAVTDALQYPLSTLSVLAPWVDVGMQLTLSVLTLVAIWVAHYNPDMLLKPPART